MSNIKLDLKDKRILEHIDIDSNISINSLAKKVALSRQSVEYRVKKLLDQKTIYSFFTFIDLGKLGYSSYRVHIKIKNLNEEDYSEFSKILFENYPVFWVAFTSGKFDLFLDVFAKTANEFEKVFRNILIENKNIIQSFEVLTILRMNIYKYGYFLKDSKREKQISMHENNNIQILDKIDKKILQSIKTNSRKGYEKIGAEVGLTRNAVKARIKKLEKHKIISGYKPIINFSHLKKESYKIFIKYDTSKIEQENELLSYIKEKEGMLASIKLMGTWDLDLEYHVDDIKKLQRSIIELRNKFSLIKDIEIVQIIEDFGIDFFPDSIISKL